MNYRFDTLKRDNEIMSSKYEKLKRGDFALFKTPDGWTQGTPREYEHLVGLKVLITKDQRSERYDEFIQFHDPQKDKLVECFRLRLTKVPALKMKITRKPSSPIKLEK